MVHYSLGSMPVTRRLHSDNDVKKNASLARIVLLRFRERRFVCVACSNVLTDVDRAGIEIFWSRFKRRGMKG